MHDLTNIVLGSKKTLQSKGGWYVICVIHEHQVYNGHFLNLLFHRLHLINHQSNYLCHHQRYLCHGPQFHLKPMGLHLLHINQLNPSSKSNSIYIIMYEPKIQHHMFPISLSHTYHDLEQKMDCTAFMKGHLQVPQPH